MSILYNFNFKTERRSYSNTITSFNFFISFLNRDKAEISSSFTLYIHIIITTFSASMNTRWNFITKYVQKSSRTFLMTNTPFRIPVYVEKINLHLLSKCLSLLDQNSVNGNTLYFQMKQLKLKSSDGEIFLVNADILKCCHILYKQLEKLDEENAENETVLIEHANAVVLKKIIEWVTYHKDDPEEVLSNAEEEVNVEEISYWDANFLNIDVKTLFELMLAANFLGIKGLINVTCIKIINTLKGKDLIEFLNEYK